MAQPVPSWESTTTGATSTCCLESEPCSAAVAQAAVALEDAIGGDAGHVLFVPLDLSGRHGSLIVSDCDQGFSAFSVAGPTSPSATRSRVLWKSRTAWAVCGP